jgi:4-amino-4-deoxy-L-arabinose transferase-like glycosyltransferase
LVSSVAPPAVRDQLLAFVDKNAPFIVMALAAFCFFFRLGSVGICDGSESYYPSAAREMVEANNYIVPQLNYQILFAKPIMIFWMIIAGYKLFGITAFGARFFSAIFAFGLTLFAYYSARAVAPKPTGARTGLIAALIVMGSHLVIDYSRLSEIDLFFSAFLGCSFLSTLMIVCAGKKKFWPLIYVGLGAALLTKGPASLVIYGTACFFAAVLLWSERRNFAAAFWSLKPHWGIPIMLGIALPWWIEVFRATDGMFPKYFFAYENFGRANGLTNTNPHYWFKYPMVLLIGLFPWSLLLPALLWRTIQSISGKGMKLPDATASTGHQADESAKSDAAVPSQLLDGKRFALGCGAAVVTLFSLSHTQMEPYLLPSVAPLAVYISLSLNDWLRDLEDGNSIVVKWTKVASFIALIVGIVLTVGGFALPGVFKLSWHHITWPVIGLPLAGLFLGGALILQSRKLRQGKVQQGVIAMALLYTVGMTIGVESGIEAWYGNVMKDLHYLCSLLDNKPGQVAFFLDCRSSVLFYVQRPVYFFFQPERLVPYSKYQFKLPEEALKFPLYVFSERKHLPGLAGQKDMTFSTIGERGKWGLYEVKGARLEPYETLTNTFNKVPLADLATKNLPTGPLTLPFGGGTFKHNAMDPYQYR